MTTPSGRENDQQDAGRSAGPQADPGGLRLSEVAEHVRDELQAGDPGAAARGMSALHPADQAAVLQDLSHDDQGALLTAMDTAAAALVVDEMHPEDAAAVASHVEPEVFSDVLEEVDPEVAADILHALGDERAETLLGEMEQEEAADVLPLLGYADDTAGGLMSPHFTAVNARVTAGNALDALRLKSEEGDDIGTIYVTDDANQLVGLVSLRAIALARTSALVADLMVEAPTRVDTGADQEECAFLMQHYGLTVLPVVDDEHGIVGVIDAETIQEVVAEEATEDMYRMAGLGEERLFGSRRRAIRSRLPWLTVNLATTFLAAAVVGLFESTIARAAMLAVFLPVVAGQGGIAGTQTLTLVVRSIALGELAGRRATRVLIREASLAAFHGVALGVLVALVGIAWKGDATLGLILGIAMLGNLLVAGVVGSGVPLLLRRLGQDPAVSAAVVVTTATDIAGFVLFLGLAALAIDRLA